MKSKKGMVKLRNRIVWCFIIVVFAVRVFDSAIDSTWDEVIAPKLYPGGDYTGIVDAGTIGYMSASFILYIISAIVFYIMVKKIIEKESLRQIQEQNLIYAAVAHDLKTPMTSVQGFAKALFEGKIKSEEVNETYQIIYYKSKSMNELVETLFEYAKCGSADYKMIYKETNLCVLLRDIVADNYCDFEQHGIELAIDIPEDKIIVSADKKELKRAITNLLVNAYKHNPDGIHVLVKLYLDGKKAKLIIADDGTQIPIGMNIFEPFVTENVARTSGKGSGLGLAITKYILDEHKAKIDICDTVPGYVKAFIVDFPIV